MKTLRQLLFERHRPVESKLDALRRNALANLVVPKMAGPRAAKSAGAATAPAPSVIRGWRDFVFSMRWHLAGMSAVWVVAVFLNLGDSSAPAVSLAQQSASPPRQLLVSLRENRRQLLEMIEPPGAEPAPAPRRRSELRPANEIV